VEPTETAGRSIKRTLQLRQSSAQHVLLGELGLRDKVAQATYTPSLYGLGEGQCQPGSNGNTHRLGTRSKGDGMR